MASTDDLNFTNGVYRSKESFDIAEGMGDSGKVGYVTKSKFYIVVAILLVVIVSLLAACGVLVYHLESKGDLAEDGSSSAVVSNQTRRTVRPTSSTELTSKVTMVMSTTTTESTSHNMSTLESTSSTISSTGDMSTDNMTSSNMSTPEITTNSMTTTETSSTVSSTGGGTSVKTSTSDPGTGSTTTEKVTSVETSSAGPTSQVTSKITSQVTSQVTSKVTSEVTSGATTKATTPTTSTAASCPSGWITTDASCLFLSTTVLAWKKAKTFCTDAGAHLVEVLTNEKHLLLKAEITNRLSTIVPFWIGLNDLSSEGKFEWSYSLTRLRSSSFSVWANNQPNNKDGKEHCVILTKNFLWNDDKCFNERNFICEIDR